MDKGLRKKITDRIKDLEGALNVANDCPNLSFCIKNLEIRIKELKYLIEENKAKKSRHKK